MHQAGANLELSGPPKAVPAGHVFCFRVRCNHYAARPGFVQLRQVLEFLLVIAAESLPQITEEKFLFGQLHFVFGPGRLDFVMLAAQGPQDAAD